MASTPELGFNELEPQEVRDYWDDEARDFTPWLAESISSDEASHLSDVLGLDLEVKETEKNVGRYQVDILAEVVDDGRQIVIENQLNDSDHDHLGKSIAYAAGLDADIIAWIAPTLNDEHRDAIQWLNQNSREGVDFFAIRLEVWKIEESPPAVRFNPVEDPSEWKEKAQRSRDELTETKKLQEAYWTTFRDKIRERDTPLRPRKPKPKHWYNNPIGKSGYKLQFTVNTRENQLYCQLVIKDDAEGYHELERQREEIEDEMSVLDETLLWRPPEEGDSDWSKITLTREGYLENEDAWDEYHDWMFECGETFYEVFYDRIQEL